MPGKSDGPHIIPLALDTRAGVVKAAIRSLLQPPLAIFNCPRCR
jgi:hypothetical protein